MIRKYKPSVFFGSMLAGFLTDLQADSIIACGGTTSGCVRATVLDGFSLNYRMSVVEECTFDRGQASHALSLFDMQAKYADVVSLEETLAFLCGLARAASVRQTRSLKRPTGGIFAMNRRKATGNRPTDLPAPGGRLRSNSCHSPSGIVASITRFAGVDAVRVAREAAASGDDADRV